jgi:hypothetical protein
VDYLKTLAHDAQWAFRDINVTDDGRTIAQAIRDSTAIGISDGSFKDGFGTASSTWEQDCPRRHGGSRFQSQRIFRLVWYYIGGVPPSASSTRFYQGAIEVGCDGIAALERRFDKAQNPSIAAQHFVLILVIRNIRARCSIRWKHRRVKGHQDDNPSACLDRWALLNIDNDLTAKDHWHRHAARRPRPLWKIYGEPWSLWISPRNLCRNLRDEIVDFIQGATAKEYWDSSDRFD